MDSIEMHFAYNEAIRQKLDHEHSVMKSRTAWHHIVQIAMFTGFYKIMSTDFPLQYTKYLLPVMGIIYAFSALYSIWVSEKARASIFMHWNRYREKHGLEWEDFPPVSGDPFEHIRKSLDDPTIRKDMNLKCTDICLAHYVPHWLMLYRFIPILFLIIWCICLFEVITLS